MVGSYEESILRGRMSTAPSRPVDFTAQIGVLGKGSCKPHCPPHRTVTFPAVYYCWSAGQGRRPVSDEPSPYVGQIDLNSTSLGEFVQDRDAKVQSESRTLHRPAHDLGNDNGESSTKSGKRLKRRRAAPAVEPPGGSYRIPEQGRLQIVIKNPNKTAIKVFLVPYDLTGMEPGTKTFVRQRFLSAGSMTEKPSAPKPGTRLSGQFDLNHRGALRYLIHLNICCPSARRFYLYQQIRVVFANRVSDNKEDLRMEMQTPDPRFSVWKPASLSQQPSSAGAKLIAEKAFRRRSSGAGYGIDIATPWSAEKFNSGTTYPFFADSAPPVPPIPFNLPQRAPTARERNGSFTEPMDIDSSRPTTSSDLHSPQQHALAYDGQMHGSNLLQGNSSPSSREYEKLDRGDGRNGGFYGRPETPEPGEGLLARSLKSLVVEQDMLPNPEA